LAVTHLPRPEHAGKTQQGACEQTNFLLTVVLSLLLCVPANLALLQLFLWSILVLLCH
jgi:hypothetical protein